MTFHVTTFYLFTPLSPEKVNELAVLFREEGKRLNICGLLLIATEGGNATFAGAEASVVEFKKFLESHLGSIMWKDSTCQKKPFKRWKVSIRKDCDK
jgi:predicted sulfurtransferase